MHLDSIARLIIYIWQHLLAALVFPDVHPGSSRAHLYERTQPREPAMSVIRTPVDWQARLEKLDPSDDDYRPHLHGFLSHQDLKPYIHDLDRPGLEMLVELLDKVGSKPDTDFSRN